MSVDLGGLQNRNVMYVIALGSQFHVVVTGFMRAVSVLHHPIPRTALKSRPHHRRRQQPCELEAQRPRTMIGQANTQVEVGEGAFAVVHRCVLRRDTSASFTGSRSKGGGARGRQLVAVKQLKPAVLENEIELHGFVAETSGGLLNHGWSSAAQLLALTGYGQCFLIRKGERQRAAGTRCLHRNGDSS